MKMMEDMGSRAKAIAQAIMAQGMAETAEDQMKEMDANSIDFLSDEQDAEPDLNKNLEDPYREVEGMDDEHKKIGSIIAKMRAK